MALSRVRSARHEREACRVPLLNSAGNGCFVHALRENINSFVHPWPKMKMERNESPKHALVTPHCAVCLRLTLRLTLPHGEVHGQLRLDHLHIDYYKY